MRYRAMVVDDEPSALQHTCSIIEKKCPGYQVVATAENGAEALELLDEAQPDIIITDVKMPRMDGIGLVGRLHAGFPDIVTVIVSGYQDFEYAKGALQSGVSDYLLKPLKPSDLQELLARLETRLNAIYHRHRTELMKAMCSHNRQDAAARAQRYFPSQRYCAAIVRRNGLPRRFSRQTGIEIFSTEEETVMLYGRDEMEALYLYPEEELEGRPFTEVVRALYEDELCPDLYVTAVAHPGAFPLHALPGIVKGLYHKLDECIVIGRNQFLRDDEALPQCMPSPAERELREQAEHYIRSENTAGLIGTAGQLFDRWAQAGHNQIYIENQIRHLLQPMRQNQDFSRTYGNYAFVIDEALYYVNSMEELKLEMLALIKLLAPSSQRAEPADDAEQLFGAILSYINGHLAEALTIGTVCRRFNVSQTTLSRWFRKFESNSFNNYLTEIRINRARQLMRKTPSMLVKDVAEHVGYCDQFYFSRIFRSVVGMCPSAYGHAMDDRENDEGE